LGDAWSFKDEDLRQRLEKETGTAVVAPVHFHAFVDVEENVRRQIDRVRSHRWIPKHISVRGFVYDGKGESGKQKAA
jgi:carbonic anhydrase